ncbi:MAG: hypothetical protein ACC645_04445, partial [Pirellulales bacterium]
CDTNFLTGPKYDERITTNKAPMRRVLCEPREDSLPKTLKRGATRTLELDVSDVPAAGEREAGLRLQLETETDVELTINDHPLTLRRSPELEKQNGMIWFTAAVPHDALRLGKNQVGVGLDKGRNASVRVTGLELLVRHAPSQ